MNELFINKRNKEITTYGISDFEEELKSVKSLQDIKIWK